MMATGLLFDAHISPSKTRQSTKGEEDREEFHFEVAEGRREGAAGGSEVRACVFRKKCWGGGGVVVFSAA